MNSGGVPPRQSGIKGNNTFFAEGTTVDTIVADLEAMIAQVRAHFAGSSLPPQFQGQFVVNGKTVQIGWLPNGPGGTRVIGQFFPVSGSGVENISKAVMKAIAKIIGP